MDRIVDDGDVLHANHLDDIVIGVLPDGIERRHRHVDGPVGVVHPGEYYGAGPSGGWPVDLVADHAQAVRVLDDVDNRFCVAR